LGCARLADVVSGPKPAGGRRRQPKLVGRKAVTVFRPGLEFAAPNGYLIWTTAVPGSMSACTRRAFRQHRDIIVKDGDPDLDAPPASTIS